MPEIGLFPLALVLVPTERVPLHIFEPRYRELIGECLAEERELGLVLADDAGVRRVGTRAAVTEVLQRFPDGRLNVIVEGRERFQLAEWTEGRSFRTAHVEPYLDEPEPVSPEDLERALGPLRRLADLSSGELVEPSEDGGQPSFELAAQVVLEAEFKQGLLEERSERARLAALGVLLERLARSAEREHEVRRRAAGNGHLNHRPGLG